MSVAEKVRGIIAEQAMLDLEDVTLDSKLEELGVDSLGIVESIFAIEEEFDITVPFNANEPEKNEFDISSVQSIVTEIEQLVAAKDT